MASLSGVLLGPSRRFETEAAGVFAFQASAAPQMRARGEHALSMLARVRAHPRRGVRG